MCKHLHGENPPTRVNHPPTPGVSAKWDNGLIDHFSLLYTAAWGSF